MVVGIAVAFAWLAVWALVLRAFGLAFFPRQAQDRAGRRERIKQMGKLRYVLIFGVLGSGLAFGLALTTADFLTNGSFRWTSGIVKLVFLAVLFGWFQGAWTWSEFRDPVPFPPEYPPPK
jgi:hypothetical protein